MYEAAETYGQALADNAAGAMVAALAALAYVIVSARHHRGVPAWAQTAALALISIIAVAWAWHLRWIADDAFISFRYARNWAEGRGLVFNPGERVEAYTNFLWMAILAGADRVGLDVPVVAIAMCLASHVAVLVLVTRLVRALAPDGRPVGASLAAIVFATSYLAASFATGGLETTFGALLVLAAVERAAADRSLAAGGLGIAATLSHPDHAIFYVALGGVLAVRRVGWRALVLYALPFVVVYVPYFVARWRYFGMPLPNSFYTKSGGASYFEQGVVYVATSGLAAGLAGVVPLAVFGLVRRRRELPAQFAIVAIPLYLAYVARIGGDFMLGRLLVPVLPWLLVFAEVGLRSLVAERRVRIAAAGAVIASLACVPVRIIPAQEFRWMLADERTFYRVESLQPLVIAGNIYHRVAVLEHYFGASQRPPVYAAYAIGILGWVTDWRIVDIHGLIDPELSRQPLEQRGRPGHERHLSRDQIARRGADLSAEPQFTGRHAAMSKVVLDGEVFYLTHYRADLVDPLRGDPRVTFVTFPEFIDQYTALSAGKPRTEISEDLAFFDRYYFAEHPDPDRRNRLLPPR